MTIECEDFWIGDSETIYWGEKDPREPLTVVFL